jgi:hypothetical protein
MSDIPNTFYHPEFAIVRVRADLIPKGARLVEAYETDTEIIVCGDPPPEPEGLTEAEYAVYCETSHNCDAMGCATLSHVIYRFSKIPSAALSEAEAARERVRNETIDECAKAACHRCAEGVPFRVLESGWTVHRYPDKAADFKCYARSIYALKA